MRDGYIGPGLRHSLCCQLADHALQVLSEAQILDYCPDDYGGTVTDDHRNLVWDCTYEEAASLDDYSLARKYEAVLHPSRETNEKFSSPYTWTKDREGLN